MAAMMAARLGPREPGYSQDPGTNCPEKVSTQWWGSIEQPVNLSFTYPLLAAIPLNIIYVVSKRYDVIDTYSSFPFAHLPLSKRVIECSLDIHHVVHDVGKF